MHYIVIKSHTASYSEALIASKGRRLRFERKPTEWQGWLWCTAADGKTGWVPESWVEIEDETCTLLRDYTTAELTVAVGEHLEGEIIESGWLWARTEPGAWGWVPMECVRPT